MLADARLLFGLKGGITRLASIEVGRLRVPAGGGDGYLEASSSLRLVADAVDSRLLRLRSSAGAALATTSFKNPGEAGEGENGYAVAGVDIIRARVV